MALADLNGDGFPDIAASGQSDYGEIGILFGNGTGVFDSGESYSTGGYQSNSIAIADINGDGYPDLLVAEYGRAHEFKSGAIVVFSGVGNGQFGLPTLLNSGGRDAVFAIPSDVNLDGKIDVVGVNFWSNTVGVLLNETFYTTKTTLASSPNPSHIGQTVTFTATITSATRVPNGEQAAFYNGASQLGTSTVTDGVATLTASFSKAGNYTIKAIYPGDAFHKASSGTVKQVVSP